MEHDSFDLNLAIREWREEFEQSGALKREDLDELESHLRDAVAAEQSAGRSPEQAFVVATRRIGPPCAIAPEFYKINTRNPWWARLGWMSLALLVPIIIFIFASGLGPKGPELRVLIALLVCLRLARALGRRTQRQG
jgi:hypothetical protein